MHLIYLIVFLVFFVVSVLCTTTDYPADYPINCIDTYESLTLSKNDLNQIKPQKSLDKIPDILSNRALNLTKSYLRSTKTNTQNEYIMNGWFVQFHNVVTTGPNGIVLTEIIRKLHGVPAICFRARDRLPFLGTPDKPIFFPKADYIGFKAITVLKIPKTGFYDFKVLTDDGIRMYYQKVKSDVFQNEKNLKSPWTLAIDSWIIQAEIWTYSKKVYFNQNDLVMVRLDYCEVGGFSSACIKMRYYESDYDTNFEEFNIPYKSSFCSLVWNEVPQLGFP